MLRVSYRRDVRKKEYIKKQVKLKLKFYCSFQTKEKRTIGISTVCKFTSTVSKNREKKNLQVVRIEDDKKIANQISTFS